MALWLALDSFEGVFNNQTWKVRSGDIMDDTIVPVASLKPFGLAYVSYVGGLAAAKAAFDEQHPSVEGYPPSIIPVLEAYGVTPSATALESRATALEAVTGVDATRLYVDASSTVTPITGSRGAPFSTLATALAAAAAGDVIEVAPGTYAEDLTTVAGVDVKGNCPPRSDAVIFTGQVIAGHIGTVVLEDLTFNEAADSAIEITGANATIVICKGCRLVAGAAATHAVLLTAANGELELWDTELRAITGNINEVCQITQGTLLGNEAALWHEDNASESLVETGAGATTVTLYDSLFSGAISVASAAANPQNTIHRGDITVGAVAAIDTDSTTQFELFDSEVVSTVADGVAITGDGVFVHSSLRFTGTATEMAGALNAAAGPGNDAAWGHRERVDNPGSVAVAQIVQAGQPVAAETLTIGADIYEADGVGANINFVIAGTAAGTMVNLLAAIVASGTENLFADAIGATVIRLRSADGPQGNIVGANPNIALTEAMTNYTFDSGNVNMNTLAGAVPASQGMVMAELTVNAGHIAAGEVRVSFPFAVGHFSVSLMTAAGAATFAGVDTFVIDNGDVLITLPGGGGDLVATDVVTIIATP